MMESKFKVKDEKIQNESDFDEDAWISFEIWLDEVQVYGYMHSTEKILNWYSWDGFDCDGFDKTNAVGYAETEEQLQYLYKWCMIENFLAQVDITDFIARNPYNSAVRTYGNQFDDYKIKVYVNCSPIEVGEYHIFNEELGVFDKDFDY